MTLCPPLADIYITYLTDTRLEICYRNLHEPQKLQLYKLVLERTANEEDWRTKQIANYNEATDCFEIIGSLYSEELVESICATLLAHVRMDHAGQPYAEKHIG